MAKKVKKDGERKEEKKVVFEPPVFDQREYLTEQLYNIRTTLFFIIIAIPMGAAWAFTAIAAGTNIAGMAVSIFGYILGTQVLKHVLGVDLLEGKKRLVATTFLMYLFTSLAFAVVLSNPPANDVTLPSVTDVIVDVQGSDPDDMDWDVLMRHRDTLPINGTNQKRIKNNPSQRLFNLDEGTSALAGDNVSILIRAGDASGLSSVVLEYGYQSIDQAPVRMERVDETRWNELNIGGDYYLWGEHYYEYVIDGVLPGNLYFRITVEDNRGLIIIFETKQAEESVYIAAI